MNNPDLEGRPVFELTKARDPDSKVGGTLLTKFKKVDLCYISI